MKNASLTLVCLLFGASLSAGTVGHLVPAGSLISCTVAEPRISSKTTAIGDPVLCQVGHAERYGRSVLPYDSYLVGRFEDYKDPGHFVGKGWMELKFDRMVIEPNTVIPIDARVVDVPGYKVDQYGRILGKGHAVRDAVMWSIPVLWPVDLLMLPMRGPRPTLKEETRLTLKVMDDLGVPATDEPRRDPYGLIPRSPTAENDVPPPYPDQPQEAAPPPPPSPMAENYDQPAPVEPPPPPPAYYPYPVAPLYFGYATPPFAVYGSIGPFGGRYGYGYAARPGVRYGYGAGVTGRYGYRGYSAPGRMAAPAMRSGGMMAMRGGGAGRGFGR